MNKTRRLANLALVAVWLVAILVAPLGCGSTGSAVKEWKLGAVYPLTGPVSWAGVLYQYFAQKAVDEINAAGGIKGVPIKLTIYDDAMDQTRASSMGAKAISDGNIMILTGTSVTLQTVGPLGKKQSCPIFNPNLGLEDINPGRPWTISFGPETQATQKFNMNAWFDQVPDIKTAVVLKTPTIQEWVTTAEVQTQYLQERGVKVVDNIDVPTPVVDASPLAIRALSKGADAVILTVNPADAFKIIQELKNRGFTNMSHIFINVAAASTELFTMAGAAGNAVDGVYSEDAWQNSTLPAYQKLLKDFQTQPGHENESSLWFVADHYMSVYLFKNVIEATGITGDPAKLAAERTKIKDYLNSIKDYDTVFWGKATMLPSGLAVRTRILTVVKGNKTQMVINSDDYWAKKK